MKILRTSRAPQWNLLHLFLQNIVNNKVQLACPQPRIVSLYVPLKHLAQVYAQKENSVPSLYIMPTALNHKNRSSKLFLLRKSISARKNVNHRKMSVQEENKKESKQELKLKIWIAFSGQR